VPAETVTADTGGKIVVYRVPSALVLLNDVLALPRARFSLAFSKKRREKISLSPQKWQWPEVWEKMSLRVEVFI
jgi:hypothetical protein